MSGDRKIKLGAFLSGSGTQGDSWRHPRSDVEAYRDFTYYARYAKTLERGKFDALFFYDNVLAAENIDLLARQPGVPRWDPLVLISALAVVTEISVSLRPRAPHTMNLIIWRGNSPPSIT